MGNSIVSKAFKVLAFVLILLTSAFLIVPIIFTVLGSFSAYWGQTMFSRGLTMRWYEYVFYYYGHTIKITLLISAVTVVVNTILGSMAAYKVCMAKNAHSKWIKFFEDGSLPGSRPHQKVFHSDLPRHPRFGPIRGD